MLLFADTNLLVYARDTSDATKHAAARAWMELLWADGQGRTSTQVLNEYYVTVTRKLKPQLPPEAARAEIRDLEAWRPQSVDAPMLEAAWSIEDRYKLSFWDSLIVAAAQGAQCDGLLTEDLQHGMDFDGLTVLSPFLTSPEDWTG